jgi:hypothetical protein
VDGLDLDSLIRADDQRQAAAAREEKRREEDLLLKKQPPKLSQAFRQALEEHGEKTMAADLRATLGAAGITISQDTALGLVRTLQKDVTMLPEDIQKALDKDIPIGLGKGTAPLRDVLRGQGLPIPGVPGVTPGARVGPEPAPGAGAGPAPGPAPGGGTVVNHFYNDGPGVFQTVRKVLSVLGGP